MATQSRTRKTCQKTRTEMSPKNKPKIAPNRPKIIGLGGCPGRPRRLPGLPGTPENAPREHFGDTAEFDEKLAAARSRPGPILETLPGPQNRPKTGSGPKRVSPGEAPEPFLVDFSARRCRRSFFYLILRRFLT